MAERATGLYFHTEGPLTPIQRTAMWTAGLSRLPRYLTALLLGALATAALPPFDLTPVLLISFVGLVWLADGNTGWRSAFALGWVFGFGFFLAGFYWIGVALLVDISQFWWLLPFAMLGVPAGFALFTGAALLLSHALCRRFALGGTARIIMLAVSWMAAEWLRGHILTGFPWNLIGYAWSGAFPGALTMLQTTAYVGIYGLSLITVLAAALPARLGDLSRGRHWPAVLAVLLIAVPSVAGWFRLVGDNRGFVPGVEIRLVQPSISLTLKHDPAAEAANFHRLLALSTSPAATRPTAIVWPETMAPPFLLRDVAARHAIAAILPPGGLALLGSIRTDRPPARPTHLWNSLVVIDHAGDIVATYDKFHLVPFGEYVPLSNLLPMKKITPGMINLSAGPGPRTLDLPGLPPLSPLICYEAIFPGAVVDEAQRPDWMLNITDDAWYGFTSGPFQDVAISRVRAVEEGLPLLRDGNNGVSAVFDAHGRLLKRLDLDDIGVLDTRLPLALAPTLYSRVKDLPFAGMLLGLLVFAGVVSRIEGRRRRLFPGDDPAA